MAPAGGDGSGCFDAKGAFLMPRSPRQTALAAALAERGWKYRRLAEETGYSEQHCTKVALGLANSSPAFRRLTSLALRQPVDELFPSARVALAGRRAAR